MGKDLELMKKLNLILKESIYGKRHYDRHHCFG